MRSLLIALLFPAVALAVPPGLKKSGPLKCAGAEQLVVSKRYIEVKGSGITAEGRCKVTITDSQIVAKEYAVSATGEAEITITNSTLKGGKSALYVVDQAKVISKGNRFSGGLLVMGQADYEDLGGNKIERSAAQAVVVAGGEEDEIAEEDEGAAEGEGEGEAEGEGEGEAEAAEGSETGESAEAAAAAEGSESAEAATVLPEKLRKSKPVVCRRNVKAITLKKRVIDTKRDGVVIYGNCVVTVEQSLIKAGGWAISHQGKGKLIIKDSILEGNKGALSVRLTPVVEIAGSTVKGEIAKPDEVEIDDQGGNTFE